VGFVFGIGGFVALVVETVLHFPGAQPVHVEAVRNVHASPDELMALYLDFARWPRLFPATIRGADLVAIDGATATIAVDHAKDGTVYNTVTVVGPNAVALEEEKERYTAHYLNHFDPAPEGCRYRLIADIELRGRWRVLRWLVPAIARRQMQRYILEPMQRAAEATSAVS
jgi:hypothetical protein